MNTSRTRALTFRSMLSLAIGAFVVSIAVAPRAAADATGVAGVTLRDGRELASAYVRSGGEPFILVDGKARPLALAAGDFDGDGVRDLVAAYELDGSGVVTLHRGNADALFPNGPEARAHKRAGVAVDSPFLSPARVFDVPERPEVLGAGDFDADGNLDIVAAERGSRALYLLTGDGRGGFAPARRFELPGTLTALVVGDVDQPDGLADVIVAIAGAPGPQLLVFESPDGALRGRPEVHGLPAEATALALGRLDDDHLVDVAAVSGRHLILLRGRDRRLSLDPALQAQAAPAVLIDRPLPFAGASVAIEDLTGDSRSNIALVSDTGELHVMEAGDRDSWHFRTTPEPGSLRWDAYTRLTQMRSTAKGTAFLAMPLNDDALDDWITLLPGRVAPSMSVTAPGTVFTVTTYTDSGTGSLRDIIIKANNSHGADTINFAIEEPPPFAATPWVINLNSPLPSINETVTIDATTQPGYSGAPLVVLTGTLAGATTSGLRLFAANCMVRGLVVNGFKDNGILITGAAATGNKVQACYIGTNTEGTAALPNVDDGIEISAGAQATIGGTTASERNVISGNSFDGVFIDGAATVGSVVQGNIIGLDVTGSVAVGNGFHPSGFFYMGVEIAEGTQGNVIGGTDPGAGNVVSGNAYIGVGIFNPGTNGNLVQGNYLGTNAAGTAAIGNVYGAAIRSGAQNNVIGGTVAGARNVISGNTRNIGTTQDGVLIDAQTGGGTTNNLVQGNYIGTNAAGTLAIPNGYHGVEIAYGTQANTVGGTAAGARNVISGNSQIGVGIFNSGTNGNFVQGNYIGLNAGGSAVVDFAEPGSPAGAAVVASGGDLPSEAIARASARGNGFHPPAQSSTETRLNGNDLDGAGPASNGLVSQNTGDAPSAVGNAIAGVAIVSGAQSNVVGGTAAGAANVISGNPNDGILITQAGTNGNRVEGNYIGTNKDGSGAIPNGFAGIEIAFSAQSNFVGGSAAGAGNVISGNNNFGVGIFNASTNSNRVAGNLIGTQGDGTSPLGNGSHGVVITNSAGSDNLIGGTPNRIAYNHGAGIFVGAGSPNPINNPFSRNAIFSNTGLGIDLDPLGVNADDACDSDAGPNNLENYPVIASATTVLGTTTIQGTLDRAPVRSSSVEFFSSATCHPSGNGGGETYLGSTTVLSVPTCVGSFNVSFPVAVPVGRFITATSTDSVGSTSEFSTCTAVTPGCVVPAEVAHVSFLADKQTLVWDSAAASGPGTVHDVSRGIVGELPVGSGASEVCLASGIVPATTADPETPPLGQTFWYLVRGRNACAGTGSYGSTSAGAPRITTVCP